MGISNRTAYPPVPTGGDTNFMVPVPLTRTVLLTLSLLLLTAINSSAITSAEKRKGLSIALLNDGSSTRRLSRAELKEAEGRLSEMGYGTGRVDGVIDAVARNAVIAFQKWEGRKVTGRLSREDFDAIMSAGSPQAKDSGYKHVEVDLDRQVLLFVDDAGVVNRVLPISSGSNKQYKEKGGSGLAYTPRGRFRIHAKIAGWRKSPLGLLYYPSYFSGGVAIHGNPSVPHEPQSHGCIRIPMSAAVEVSRLLPVGTIVLVYDKQSFVSAKDWAEADKQNQEAETAKRSH
jgi:peptidoglycan hydrolase-like protein with peptidoglycan-binding domain